MKRKIVCLACIVAALAAVFLVASWIFIGWSDEGSEEYPVGDKFLVPVWHRATLDLMAAIALIGGSSRFVGTVVSYRAGHTLDCDAIRALRRNDLLASV